MQDKIYSQRLPLKNDLAPQAVGTSMIFVNSRNEILLVLRDDIPQIKCPGMWDLPGGGVEEGETPAECIRREMEEELGLSLTNFKLFQVKEHQDRLEYTFWLRADLDLEKITLTEGQRLEWFSRERARETVLAFGFNETVESFFAMLPALL